MRFSARVAAWSLLYGLTQLVLLCLSAVAAVAVGGVVVALLASFAARIAMPLVDRDLATGFDLTEQAVSATELNITAQRLETVAADMGVQLAPTELPDRPRPTQQAHDVFAAVSDELLGVCRLESVDPHLSSFRRYEVWRRFQRPLIDEAMAIILDGDPPLWAYDPARDGHGPATDLTGHLWLHRVLVAEAAIAAAQHDGRAAARALEASWRLNQGLLTCPQLAACQTATTVLELQMAALRRSRMPSGEWPARLASLDPRREALASYAREARQAQRRAGTALGERSPVLGLIAQPFVRLSMVHGNRALVTAVSHLEGEPITNFDPDRFAAQVIESVPRWNVLARSTLPTGWDWWRRAVHATLAAELTGQVLAIRGLGRSEASAELGDRGSSWTSRIVGMTWERRFDDDGVSIAVEPDVPSQADEFRLTELVAFDSGTPGSV